MLGVFGGLVIGAAIGGLLRAALGVTAPFWFAFAGSAVFVVLIWRQLRHIAHDDEPVTDPPRWRDTRTLPLRDATGHVVSTVPLPPAGVLHRMPVRARTPRRQPRPAQSGLRSLTCT